MNGSPTFGGLINPPTTCGKFVANPQYEHVGKKHTIIDDVGDIDIDIAKQIIDGIHDTHPYQKVLCGRTYTKFESVRSEKKQHTITDILEHCAKLRGVSGLPWRTLHEFFWFVAACKWGDRNAIGDDTENIFERYGSRSISYDESFEKMLVDHALLFEVYCEDEYGGSTDV